MAGSEQDVIELLRLYLKLEPHRIGAVVPRAIKRTESSKIDEQYGLVAMITNPIEFLPINGEQYVYANRYRARSEALRLNSKLGITERTMADVEASQLRGGTVRNPSSKVPLTSSSQPERIERQPLPQTQDDEFARLSSTQRKRAGTKFEFDFETFWHERLAPGLIIGVILLFLWWLMTSTSQIPACNEGDPLATALDEAINGDRRRLERIQRDCPDWKEVQDL